MWLNPNRGAPSKLWHLGIELILEEILRLLTKGGLHILIVVIIVVLGCLGDTGGHPLLLPPSVATLTQIGLTFCSPVRQTGLSTNL